jgi:hypothetical protein
MTKNRGILDIPDDAADEATTGHSIAEFRARRSER